MMGKLLRPVMFVSLAAMLCACGSFRRDEIEGNNTGGIIPPSLAKGDVQASANAHCARYGRVAKITFTQAETSGGVVFVCVAANTAPPEPLAPTSPAPKRPPIPPAKQ